MLFIGVLKEVDGVDALIKLYRLRGKSLRQRSEGTSSTSCLHDSFIAVSPFNYLS